ncbi:hypothetical protein A2U01_0112996, partial [Trifolium medium]|nr:hypothetical protein [Trifolium medium]
ADTEVFEAEAYDMPAVGIALGLQMPHRGTESIAHELGAFVTVSP